MKNSSRGLIRVCLLGGLLLSGAQQAAASEGWPVVCRSDARTTMTYVPGNGGTLTIKRLKPAPRGARERRPGAGQCAFYDRPMNRDGETNSAGELEFLLRLPPGKVRYLQIIPRGRGSTLVTKDANKNRLISSITRGEISRFMAKRIGRGKYKITSLVYDTSRFDGNRASGRKPRDTQANANVRVKEDCIGFNRKNLRMKKIQGRWKIVEGNHWLFDFNGHRDEAKRALAIINHYRMNKVCYVQRPNPAMTYLLSGSSAPRGSYRGEDCVSFDPKRIEAKRIKGRWKVVDGNHWMFDFGNKADAARKAVKVIRKYGFTKSCFVGRPDPSFQYLRK